jgi:hypothetical protein
MDNEYIKSLFSYYKFVLGTGGQLLLQGSSCFASSLVEVFIMLSIAMCQDVLSIIILTLQPNTA